ncbi:hypothetical protein O3M35_005826 [Rhynocoris fuscipes]|uniref:Uncharacterized protein n=1 Tax=Rhynocoris fuscipes TaxID=488301 RepID=A0AAW1DK00_9HEMI
MRIRRNKIPKSHREKTNLQVVRCHICQNVNKIILSKPAGDIVPTNGTSESKAAENVLMKKKKKRKKDRLAGLSIGGAAQRKQSSTVNIKQSNIEILSGEGNPRQPDRNILPASNIVHHSSKLQPDSSSSLTSNHLLNNILLSTPSFKHTDNSVKSTKNNKKAKLKKKKHKVNQLKNFINSL